jgi:outer membrane protein assembly factor BamB
MLARGALAPQQALRLDQVARVVAITVLLAVPLTALGGGYPASPFLGLSGAAATLGPSSTGWGSHPPFPSAFPHLAAGSPRGSIDDWPQFHSNPRLTGYSASSTLSTSNATRLGVAWATDLFGAALDSPVVAYDPSLRETLAYVGTESGNVLAVNVANGQIVWGTWLGSPIRATPAVADGAVFIGTDRNAAVFKLNASTGAVDCRAISPQPIEGSPTVVHFPRRNATVFVGTVDSSTVTGPLLAIDSGSCAIDWTFSGFPIIAGSWDPVASAVNATGVPLVLFGTADPDAGVYAIDALTGVEVWRFQTYNPPPGVYDIGAGVTVSPPGAMGFAHGVAYVPSKYGIMYALDLTNGTKIWSVDFNKIAGVNGGGRSTAALQGRNLVFGFTDGLFDLNASTGAVVWKYNDSSRTEAVSSPAIAGPSRQAIAAVADLAGGLDVVSMANGTPLYHYQTGGYVTASPAVSSGRLLLCSTDGFLYEFAVGGGNDAVLPTTTIASPTTGSALPNPNGNVLVRGTATDPKGLSGVVVAVQSSGTGGPWWDASAGSWVPGPAASWATINRSANGTTGSWSFAYPAPSAGGTYQVTAYAVAASGQSDLHPATSGFSVNFSAKGPHLRATATYVAPAGSVTLLGGGFGSSETVAFDLRGSVLATEKSSATGYLRALTVTLPAGAAFARTSLVATGLSSGRSATAPIIVANNWDQFGYDARHLAYEPNDPALNNLVSPGGHIWVDLAWHFDTGAGVLGSPAIANGVAYVADSAGEVFAVDIQNGGLIWNWSDPSGAAFNSSPAVDAPRGLVVVTATDGSVYALSTTTGGLRWNSTVGGNLTSPVLYGGELYLTSSTGKVEGISDSNGTSLWSVTLPAPVRAPATLDPTRERLFIGETNGDLVALNSTTGARNWTYVAGSAILGAPVVSGSTVYVGTANGNVSALKESTGSRIWTYRAGGAVWASPVLTGNGTPGGYSLELLVGARDGNVSAIDAVHGTLNYKIAIGAPVVGLATAKGVVLFETSTGVIAGARTYTNLTVWKYHTAAGLQSAPAIVDGAIYVAAGDGYLYAFTTFGQAPD